MEVQVCISNIFRTPWRCSSSGLPCDRHLLTKLLKHLVDQTSWLPQAADKALNVCLLSTTCQREQQSSSK